MHSPPPDDETDLMALGRYLPTAVFNTERFRQRSMRARLVLYGLYEICDSEGRMLGNPAIIKDMLAATDPELTAKRIETALGELHDHGLIYWYVADNRRVISLPRYREQQPRSLHLERAAPSRLPPPPTTLEEVRAVIVGPKSGVKSGPDSGVESVSDSGPDSGSDSGVESNGSSLLPSRALPSSHPRVPLEKSSFSLTHQEPLSPPVVPLSPEKRLTVKTAVKAVRKLRGTDLLEGLKAMLDHATPESYAPVRREDTDAAFALVWFGYWMAAIGFRDDMLDDQREALIRRRYIEANRDGDMLLYVVDGVRKDHFRMGRDPRKGDDPRLRSVGSILKNFEVMQELARKGGWKAGQMHPVRKKLVTHFGE